MGKTSITPSAIPWKRWRLFCIPTSVLLLIILMCITASSAYSVLTHEEIVDLLWSDEIQPLILKRFPGIGDPGADKILLCSRGAATLAPESNALRVLLRHQDIVAERACKEIFIAMNDAVELSTAARGQQKMAWRDVLLG